MATRTYFLDIAALYKKVSKAIGFEGCGNSLFTSIDCYPKKRGCRGSRGPATSFPGFSPTLGTRLGDPLPGTWKAGLEGEKKDARSHHPSLVLLACLACSRVPQSPLVKEADTKACVSWGKAFHKLLEIFQKVSRNFSKSCSKVAKKKTIKSCSLH